MRVEADPRKQSNTTPFVREDCFKRYTMSGIGLLEGWPKPSSLEFLIPSNSNTAFCFWSPYQLCFPSFLHPKMMGSMFNFQSVLMNGALGFFQISVAPTLKPASSKAS